MAKTDRVLVLLEALQDSPSASGPELARRLGVDVRTVRRDVVSLRDLGIPVEAERGPAGGYRLRPGYRMPPLMLTADEATTVALGLIAARHDGLDAGGALAKIRRVLPARVRLRVEALEHTLGFTRPGHDASPAGEHLLLFAEAARRGRRVRAHYTATDGAESDRELSPYWVVAHAGRWYVPAHDHGRDAPRTFRADRFGAVRIAGAGRPPPPGYDAVEAVSRTLARVPWTHAVEVVLHQPLERARALPRDARRAGAGGRAHAPAHAHRVTRLGGRPARRERHDLRDPPAGGAAHERPRARRPPPRHVRDQTLDSLGRAPGAVRA
jgi:predicted DNA-binding transcriptional regulator YafY